MKRVWRNKGAALAEAIVAMAIIVVVSVAAMALVSRFATLSAKNQLRNEAVQVTENCMECFLFAQSKDLFEYCLVMDAGVQYTNTDVVAYTVEGQNYTINMQVSFGASSATFAATVRDDNDRMILSVPRYEKYY